MKKILFVSLPEMGGCQRATVNYAKILHATGYNCEFLLWIDSVEDDNELQYYVPNGIPIYFLNCRLRETPWVFYKFIREHHGYDCVFCSWTLFNISLCIAKCLPFNGIRHLVIRDDNMPSKHGRLEQLLLRLLHFCPDLYIAQTNEMKQEADRIYRIGKKSLTINNPIDKAFIDSSINGNKDTFTLNGSPIYVAVGRVSPQKDYATLLNAFSVVRQTQSLSHLYILGADDKDNTYGQEMRKLQQDLGLSECVTFMGFQSNPYQYIAQADVFVMSSIYEGLPNVMLEAIYIGKPVAVTNCIPYIDQVIEDGVYGYKAKVKDAQSLANAMIKATSMKSLSKGIDINDSENLVVDTFKTLLE